MSLSVLNIATDEKPVSNSFLGSQAINVDTFLTDLTKQQMKVALLLSQGHSNKVIGYELRKSQATIKAHISVILRQLGCTNRTQAALLIFQWLSMKSRATATG